MCDVAGHQHFARRSIELEWMAGLEPASARRQRAALPLSYTHGDGRRDGIRTRAGLSPDRFAGGRLRLLGHSALAAEEGLEPPIYRLTAGRCAAQLLRKVPSVGPPRLGVNPARPSRAGTPVGTRFTRRGEPSLGVEPSPRPYRGRAQPLSYKGVGLAGTTRTCCLRLRRAALCPDELRRDGVDARGRTWNTRLRRPVLCPLSYVDQVERRGSGAVRTPEAHWGRPRNKAGSSTIRIASPDPARAGCVSGGSGTRTHAAAGPPERCSKPSPCPAWVSLPGVCRP